MLRKSPTLFALAVFVLALGWSITPVQARCTEFGPHSGNHPHCRNAGGGPTNKARYDVTVFDDLSTVDPITNLPISYVGRDGGGKSKPVSVGFQVIDMGLVSFFYNKFDKFVDQGRGTKCFGNAPVVGNTISLSIYEEKDGSAYGTHWFTGHLEDGITEITYLLEMLNEEGNGFEGAAWRPTNGMTTLATFTSWEMSINGNNELACTGAGDFFVEIEVENTTQ